MRLGSGGVDLSEPERKGELPGEHADRGRGLSVLFRLPSLRTIAFSRVRNYRKEVAHLTSRRASFGSNGPDWPSYEIFSALVPIMRLFCVSVDPERVVVDFRERVEAADSLREREPDQPYIPGESSLAALAALGATQAAPGTGEHQVRGGGTARAAMPRRRSGDASHR